VLAVLFDFGGTLDADGVPWRERAFRLFRAEALVSAPGVFDRIFYAADDALVGAIPPTLSFRDTVVRLFTGVTRGLGLPSADAIAERLAVRFLTDSLARLRDNAPFLRRLSERYRLGVVSNFYGNLGTVCSDGGIRSYFTTLVDSARVGCRKPDPAIFHHALDALGVTPETALFVGDSLGRDMAGARAIGLPHIWLTAASSGQASCCGHDRVVHSLRELEGLLL
jgi:putative hydrolase of the HAD superfamily